MKLLYKFFLAFFITNLSIVCLLLVLIDSKFTTSFNNFVEQAESEQIESNKITLIEIYRRNSNWQPIVDDVQVWRDIVDPRPNPPPKKDVIHSSIQSDGQRSMPNVPEQFIETNSIDNSTSFLKTGRRLSLYDSNKNVIVGNEHIAQDHRFEAITFNGETIGWLGLRPAGAISESPASDFLAQLHQNMIYVGVITISLAFLMAWILSNHLIAPIQTVINGTHELISGNYRNRITKTTRDEIGKLSDDVNNLANTLEAAQENRFQWMSDTSHELRTPLTVLKAQVEAIQDGLMTADKKTLIGIVDEIDSLSKIVDDVYQLSSSDSGALTYNKETLDPTQVLKSVIDNFQSKLLKKKLTCEYSNLEEGVNAVFADKTRLTQLFTNLLENSYRYTDAKGKIGISTAINNEKKEVLICIEDSYPGLNQAAQQKIFERFYRVEQSRNRSHGGSGLGLALCDQIVQAHDGRIEVSDSHLGGVKMTITLLLQ